LRAGAREAVFGWIRADDEFSIPKPIALVVLGPPGPDRMNTLVSSGGSVTTLRHLNVLIAASNFPIAGELAPSL
jgi:hypothetical protein